MTLVERISALAVAIGEALKAHFKNTSAHGATAIGTAVHTAASTNAACAALNTYTAPQADAKFATKDFVVANSYIPVPPSVDGNGKVESFAKYNFSCPARSAMYYVVDADARPYVLFIAHDGNPANTNLFAAEDISVGAPSFRWSNAPIRPNFLQADERIISILAVSCFHISVSTSAGRSLLITTNGSYAASDWTLFADCTALLAGIGGDAMFHRLVVGINDLIVVVTGFAGNPNPVRMNVFTKAGTLVTSDISLYDQSWVDFEGFAGISSDSLSYWGELQITRKSPTEFYISQHRIVYSANSYRIVDLMSKVVINESGAVVLNDAPTVGWKFTGNGTSSIDGMTHPVSGSVVWFDELNGTGWTRTHSSNYQAYEGQNVHKAGTWANTYLAPSSSIDIQIPDTSPISKSATPGDWVELEFEGSTYILRTGTSTNGTNCVLYRAELVNNVPTPVSNGLKSGKTFQTLYEIQMSDGVGYLFAMLHGLTYNIRSADGKNRTYVNYRNAIYRLDTDGSTVLATAIPCPFGTWSTAFATTASLQTISVIHDPITNTTFIVRGPNDGVSGKLQLYKVVGGVETLIGEYGTVYGASRWPNVLPLLDFTANALLVSENFYTVGGANSCRFIHPLGTSDIVQGTFGWAYSPVSMFYSAMSGSYCCTYTSNADLQFYQKVEGFDTLAYGTGQVTTYEVALLSSIGLTLYLNDAQILLGGYTTGVFEGLTKNGLQTTIELLPNATNYVYLSRVGTDKLVCRTSTTQRANTFNTVLISTIITDANGALSQTNHSIRTTWSN